jgi:hypothetical protein
LEKFELITKLKIFKKMFTSYYSNLSPENFDTLFKYFIEKIASDIPPIMECEFKNILITFQNMLVDYSITIKNNAPTIHENKEDRKNRKMVQSKTSYGHHHKDNHLHINWEKTSVVRKGR